MSDLVYLHCSACAAEEPFETPPCADGHGDACPERLCVECGAVVAVAPTPLDSTSLEPAA